ncbi:hypothetical protein Pyn_36812 [Prunus yedoensis var. nudiflora]|uniref:Uncharacterized protein n=1 Tax=Prunus yedoensis var. nudiflora TaxID=2094558 RepID=A0A314UP88_PRUYE|nr:hypothetical protein Pyn_36812 [Prunus yedoensis var. nudiflora]
MSRELFPKNYLDPKIQFHFGTSFTLRENTLLKVKKCGVRIMYEQDPEELNRIMKQYCNETGHVNSTVMRQDQAILVPLEKNHSAKE